MCYYRKDLIEIGQQGHAPVPEIISENVKRLGIHSFIIGAHGKILTILFYPNFPKQKCQFIFRIQDENTRIKKKLNQTNKIF